MSLRLQNINWEKNYLLRNYEKILLVLYKIPQCDNLISGTELQWLNYMKQSCDSSGKKIHNKQYQQMIATMVEKDSQ